MTTTIIRSDRQLVDELRGAPASWVDSAIVVAFEDRFEFVGEDHADPMGRLGLLQAQGGLAIGLAGLKLGPQKGQSILTTRVFSEYLGQTWAHRYMDVLGGMVRSHSKA